MKRMADNNQQIEVFDISDSDEEVIEINIDMQDIDVQHINNDKVNQPIHVSDSDEINQKASEIEDTDMSSMSSDEEIDIQAMSNDDDDDDNDEISMGSNYVSDGTISERREIVLFRSQIYVINNQPKMCYISFNYTEGNAVYCTECFISMNPDFPALMLSVRKHYFNTFNMIHAGIVAIVENQLVIFTRNMCPTYIQ